MDIEIGRSRKFNVLLSSRVAVCRVFAVSCERRWGILKSPESDKTENDLL